jgi:hypothetical protein
MLSSKVAVFLGTLSVLAIPVGLAAAQYRYDVGLLDAGEVAVPIAFVLGLAAVSASRRARYRLDRSVRRHGRRVVALGRLLAWTGVYLALTGALTLGFYGLLVLND